MPETSLCLKVKKIHGEKALVLANKIGISNRELEIHRNAQHIYVPLIRQPDKTELSKLKAQLPDFELETGIFTKKKQKLKTLDQILANQLPPHLLDSLPHAL
jgi:tRNA G37 N-methylase Trm5